MTSLSRNGGPAFGAHAFIWAGEWTREGAGRVISGAAEAGLDFVEIPLLDHGSMDLEHTRALLDHHGLGCSCSLGLPREFHLPFNPEGAGRFLDEAVNRYETYLLNLASQAGELLDRIDEPNVFVHLDTYHMNIEEKGFYEPIVSLGSRLGYVHLSESDRGTPGTANVHWDEVFRGLEDIDYGGALAMESFAAVNEAIVGATALWRDVVGDPDALVRDGLAFLRSRAREHGVLL